MILIDTSVFIVRRKTKDATFVTLFDSSDIAVCGPVRAEALTGCRNDRERQTTKFVLNQLKQLTILESHWDEIGGIRAEMQMHGVQLSLADTAIGAVAILNACELWSRDNAQVQMAQIIPALRLFQPPP